MTLPRSLRQGKEARMKIPCDLHLHSYCSDGELSPGAVIELAAKAKLDVVSLTDHDNVRGVAEAQSAAEALKIKLIPGIEISSLLGLEVHILGYNVPYNDKAFIEEIENILDLRKQRNEEIVRKLKAQGIKLRTGELFEDGVKGRQYIATLLYEQGYVRSRAEAFDKYIGANKSCFVKTHRMPSADAVKLILKYGGVPVIAHPMRYAGRVALAGFVDELVKAGLMGLEFFYPNQRYEDIKFLKEIAEKHSLILTGGSDFHSAEYGSPIGSVGAYLDEKAARVLKLV
ncbi:MAG: PHP domain-containing protein [Clostridia bacterium]|nr:PHP domain-containing protein [Clostridia bacterium]